MSFRMEQSGMRNAQRRFATPSLKPLLSLIAYATVVLLPIKGETLYRSFLLPPLKF